MCQREPQVGLPRDERGGEPVAPGVGEVDAVELEVEERSPEGRPHQPASEGFVSLHGANAKINKRQLWIEAGAGGVIIGRFSEANPVEVSGRLIQSGGQIAVDRFPVDVSLSNGEMNLTIHRVERS